MRSIYHAAPRRSIFDHEHLTLRGELIYLFVMTNAIATTILEQLGGNRFLAMTGAHSLTAEASSLTMKLPRISKVWTVKITLEASDTYTVTAYKRRPAPKYFETLEPVSDVYAENLALVFKDLTGLDTSL